MNSFKMVIEIRSLFYIILMCVIISTISCKKDETINNPDIEINKILIKDIGDFDFKDSLIIAVENSNFYEVCVVAEPSNAEIYFSKYGDVFEKQKGDGILIDSSFKSLLFYSELKGYNRTEIKQLSFGYKKDSLISDIKFFPNPCKKDLYIDFEVDDNVVGKIEYRFYNLAGMVKKEKTDFIYNGLYKKKLDLTELGEGIYFLRIEFGNSVFVKKIMKVN